MQQNSPMPKFMQTMFIFLHKHWLLQKIFILPKCKTTMFIKTSQSEKFEKSPRCTAIGLPVPLFAVADLRGIAGYVDFLT
jgi:hypothetical protein